MKIHCNQAFKDGTRCFEPGDVCTVPDQDATRFIAHGWASAEEPTVSGPDEAHVASTDLTVQSVRAGHTSITSGA